MDIRLGLISLFVGYVIGSISFTRILTKIKTPETDLEKLSSRNIAGEDVTIPGAFGANAASIATGSKLGLIVASLDILKAVIPMFVIKMIYKGEPYYLFSGLGGLLGHNWPIYHGFKGGRGFAVILGSFFVIDWIAPFATTLSSLFLGMVILGSQEISAILWMWLMIPWMIWRGGTWEIVYSIVINIIYLIGAIPEIKTMQRFKKSGKYQEYTESMYKESPQWQGMKNMTDRLWILRPLFKQRRNEEDNDHV